MASGHCLNKKIIVLAAVHGILGLPGRRLRSSLHSFRKVSRFSLAVRPLSPFLTGQMFVRPNIFRTLRRTMIRFLIELLVRRTWFGQCKLYFVLKWLVMRCKLRPKLAADAQQGNSTNYCLILGPRDKAAPPTSQQIPSEASEEPSDTVIHFYFYFFFIHRRALLSASQRQCSSNRTNVPRTC